MKALTLKHPWAFAVAHLGKDVENRTWAPPRALHGEFFAIHGGALPTGRALLELCECVAYGFKYHHEAEIAAYHERTGLDVKVSDTLTPGLVAVARLAGVVRASDSPWFYGPIGWRLADVFTLPSPVPCRGAQGLWDVPENALAEVLRQGWRP